MNLPLTRGRIVALRARNGAARESELRPAVHRTIVCVDVEKFADPRRTRPHQLAVRRGLYSSLRDAFGRSRVPWENCYKEDRGDGMLVLVPSEVPKELLVTGVPRELAKALAAHNQAQPSEARIRLRLAVHAGEIHLDAHGVTGGAVNSAFRMLEAQALKNALNGSAGVLALAASPWFFEEVIRHTPASAPESYRQTRISVKETRDTAWICLPDDPYPRATAAALPAPSAERSAPSAERPAPPMAAVPRQLPVVTWGFAGRVAELAELTSALEEAAEDGGTVVISAIEGTAGIGKTTLAVYWAHQVADRFPDGQLYVNLRGFDPAGSPMAPAEAVRGFLDALGVPPERIPVSLHAQTALYRSLLAGRRVLVVLDNALDAAQVRPLLPGSAACMAVVTSRNRLTSLVAAEGARLPTVDLLTPAEARQLLAGRLGAGRVAADSPAIEEIITSCARLPLALSIVAARASAHLSFPMAALARELDEARGGLEAFDGGEQAAQVRAVFSWSYQQLSLEAAGLFRRLGLQLGHDVTVPAAASLAGVTVASVRSAMAELARSHLVNEHTPGRYTFHDLLRACAAELAHTHDPEPERRKTLHRVLDHYVHTAYAAAILVYPRTDPIIPAAPHTGVAPEKLADYLAAWTWFEAEYPTLLASIQQAADTGHNTHAWQLPALLEEFFRRRGHWHDWAAAQRTALAAAQSSADRRGQAHAHRGLGRAYMWLMRHDEAHGQLQQALRLFEELGDQVGQANVHTDLDSVLEYQGRPAEALTYAKQCLALSRSADNMHGQARALNGIGWFHALLGHHRQALTCCQEALTLARELDDRRLESHTLDSLGYAHHHLGRYEQAAIHFKQALALRRELGDRWGQAVILTHLGDTQHAVGNFAAARSAWQQALDILGQLDAALGVGLGAGYPDADEIRTRLHRLENPAP